MAKRKRPDQAITDKHVAILRTLSARTTRRRKLVDDAELELGNAVRAAFAEGVLVGPMKEATGLSGSRLYQIKFEHRGKPLEAGAAV